VARIGLCSEHRRILRVGIFQTGFYSFSVEIKKSIEKSEEKAVRGIGKSGKTLWWQGYSLPNSLRILQCSADLYLVRKELGVSKPDSHPSLCHGAACQSSTGAAYPSGTG